MTENKDKQAWSDEEFLRQLPPAAIRRLTRITCDMMELDLCRKYGLEPGSLLPDLPDPIESGLSPERWEEKAETLAQEKSNPLHNINDPDELYEIHLKQQASRKEGQDEGGEDDEA